MTTREFLNAILTADVSDELKAQAQVEIDRLDKRNAQRKSKPSKTAIANAPIKEAIIEFAHKTEAFTAGKVAEALELTVQKASALLRQLETEGVLTSTQGKVKIYKVAE